MLFKFFFFWWLLGFKCKTHRCIVICARRCAGLHRLQTEADVIQQSSSLLQSYLSELMAAILQSSSYCPLLLCQAFQQLYQRVQACFPDPEHRVKAPLRNQAFSRFACDTAEAFGSIHLASCTFKRVRRWNPVNGTRIRKVSMIYCTDLHPGRIRRLKY